MHLSYSSQSLQFGVCRGGGELLLESVHDEVISFLRDNFQDRLVVFCCLLLHVYRCGGHGKATSDPEKGVPSASSALGLLCRPGWMCVTCSPDCGGREPFLWPLSISPEPCSLRSFLRVALICFSEMTVEPLSSRAECLGCHLIYPLCFAWGN